MAVGIAESNAPPNLVWRGYVRSAFRQFRPVTDDPEAEFLRYVDDLHRSARERARPAADLELYILSVALLTYGRLDAVEDVLAHLPDGRHPARTLARSVSTLVPLPPGLDPLHDAQATAAWVRAHRDELIWRPEDGRFARGAASTR
jgi:hypothetical protein